MSEVLSQPAQFKVGRVVNEAGEGNKLEAGSAERLIIEVECRLRWESLQPA